MLGGNAYVSVLGHVLIRALRHFRRIRNVYFSSTFPKYPAHTAALVSLPIARQTLTLAIEHSQPLSMMKSVMTFSLTK